MNETARWVGRLEVEIGRELGQAVGVSPGGELPGEERSLVDALELPGARLALAVDREQLAAVLVEGRLIETAQGDAETVRELWAGILSSVCARLGGRLADDGDWSENMQPCSLRMGTASMRMGVAVDSAALSEEPGLPGGNYDLLLDVELDTSVRFGSREMELGELLDLGPGDVVELDRQVSDPVDLIVGDKIIARGEVVLVDGNFGLRVTEVAEPMRRLESIR